MRDLLRELEIRVASLEREAGRGLPVSKLQRYANTGFFAVSAYRPHARNEEGVIETLSLRMNKMRNQSLRDMIKTRLLVSDRDIIPLRASWVDSASGASGVERSYLVPGKFDFNDCQKISDDWEQDAFIWTDGSHPVGMYDHVKRAVTVLLDNTIEERMNISTDSSLYSKGRGGGSFELPFAYDHPIDWDGVNPITYAEIIEAWGDLKRT